VVGSLDGIRLGSRGRCSFRGAADAPVTLIEYSDYLCPFCARHFAQTVPTLIERYIRTGQVKWVFRDFPIASLHPTAAQGHMAAQCVGEQGADLYWQMHDTLFATQDQWNQLPDPGAYLAQVAQGLGADMAAYSACVASGRSKAVVDNGIAEADALGFNGTPTFRFLGGKAALTRWMGAAGRYVCAVDRRPVGGKAPQK
jgi:protein-disulfide isomerase